jgi:hypothetical protein
MLSRMDRKNFWVLLYAIEERLAADQNLDAVLNDFRVFNAPMGTDMRETLANVIGRLAVLQTGVPLD